MKFPACPRIFGLKIIQFSAEPKGEAVESKQFVAPKQALPQAPRVLAMDNVFVEADKRFAGDEASTKSTPETPMAHNTLPAGKALQVRESLNRLDTRLCFALAREDLGLKARLMKERHGIEMPCEEMDEGIPDKLLPTGALQSKKHRLELEMAKAQLQFHDKPTATQVEWREALDRELSRRIPGRRAEQSKEKKCLQGLSNNEFLNAYQLCAQQLYHQAGSHETPYESLVSFWGKWQTHTQEAEERFGEAWLWQYL